MVKNRQEIQLNYRKTLRQADELEELARQIDVMTTCKIDNAMNELSRNWRGEEGNLYRQKGNRLNRVTLIHGETLRKMAEVLRVTAQSTYRAELRAAELAEKRWHG